MKVRNLMLAVALLILILPQSAVQAASTEEQEIEEFIVKLYDVKEKGDEAALKSTGASEVQIMSDLTLVECGLEEYHNLKSYIYPTGENTWLVVVGYEMEVEGVDVWLPGLTTEYVIKDGQGRLMLPWQSEEIPPMVNQHAELTETNPEISGLFEAYNDSYTQILQNDSSGEVQEFNEKVRETYDKILRERGIITEDDSRDDKSVESDPDSYYTVQPGDCLWSIAKEHLGSGSNWSVIYDNNREIIGEFPDLIFPGQKLEIN